MPSIRNTHFMTVVRGGSVHADAYAAQLSLQAAAVPPCYTLTLKAFPHCESMQRNKAAPLSLHSHIGQYTSPGRAVGKCMG